MENVFVNPAVLSISSYSEVQLGQRVRWHQTCPVVEPRLSQSVQCNTYARYSYRIRWDIFCTAPHTIKVVLRYSNSKMLLLYSNVCVSPQKWQELYRICDEVSNHIAVLRSIPHPL